ncbi:hypothetical protein ACPCSE_29475 [Streptomyces cellulosae]
MRENRDGKPVSLVYDPDGTRPAERLFLDVTTDELVFLIAGLAGRRYQTREYGADIAELRKVLGAQTEMVAAQMVHALVEGLGRWRFLLPKWVQRRIVVLQMDFVRGTTANWVEELVGMHAEVARSKRPPLAQRVPGQRRPRSAPENGPRMRCSGGKDSTCDQYTLLTPPLPEGWTLSDDSRPRCPEHSVAGEEDAA